MRKYLVERNSCREIWRGGGSFATDDTINVIKEYFNVILKTLDHIIIKKVRAVQEDLVRKESEEATKEEKSEEYEYYYEEEEQAADTK